MKEEWWSSTLKGDSVGNTFFGHRSLHKYTSVARFQNVVEVKSMIDLVLVRKDLLRYGQDVRAVLGMR